MVPMVRHEELGGWLRGGEVIKTIVFQIKMDNGTIFDVAELEIDEDSDFSDFMQAITTGLRMLADDIEKFDQHREGAEDV